MTAPLDVAKIVALVFASAVVQTSVLAALDVGAAVPNLLLVVLIAVALLRGSIAGAAAGFAAGLLVDVASLSTLGLTSLLLTLAGYWTGRYGETTGRDKARAPLLSAVVVTVLFQVGAYALHFLLGDAVDARRALAAALPVTVLFNAGLVLPAYALSRRLLPRDGAAARAREVSLVG